jgi:hypothetical protein
MTFGFNQGYVTISITDKTHCIKLMCNQQCGLFKGITSAFLKEITMLENVDAQ